MTDQTKNSSPTPDRCATGHVAPERPVTFAGIRTETLRTLRSIEKQIPARDGRWFSVRVMLYRRLDNVVDGVVVTFVDITATKELEAALRKNQDF